MPKKCGCDPAESRFCNEYRMELESFMAHLSGACNALLESVRDYHRKQAQESQAWLDDHMKGE